VQLHDALVAWLQAQGPQPPTDVPLAEGEDDLPRLSELATRGVRLVEGRLGAC